MAQISETDIFIPPGIGTGAAYASLDAIGKPFWIAVPKNGVIYTARYFDRDDEGLQVDLILFRSMISMPTDNNALTLSNEENEQVLGRIEFNSTFSDFANNQYTQRGPLGIAYTAPAGKIVGQIQAKGALNIAAGELPRFQLAILDLTED